MELRAQRWIIADPAMSKHAFAADERDAHRWIGSFTGLRSALKGIQRPGRNT